MTKKPALFIVCVLGSGLLPACGGGGGGGGGPAPPPEPVTYAGSTAPVALTTANAADVTGNAWNAIAVAQSMADLGISLGVFTGEVDETRDGPGGGTVSVVGELTNGVGEVTIVFDNYRSAGGSGHIDGQYRQQIRQIVEDTSIDETLYFDRLTYTTDLGAGVTTVAVSGQVDRQSFDATPGARRTVHADVVFHDEQSGKYGWLQNILIDRRAEVPAIGGRVVETYSGAVYDSELGVATIASTGGLWLRDVGDEGLPYGGGSLKISSNGSAVRLRPVTGTHVALLFDDTDDGTSDRSKLVTWDDLIGGTAPQPGGDRPPLAAAATVNPVQTGTQFDLDGYLSSDPDGDWLTYEWQVELAPIGGEATMLHSQSPEARLTPPLAGDYLVTLRVSDGQHQVWDSTSISVADVVAPEQDVGTPMAVFPRPPDTAVGQPIQLDAGLSFSTRFDDALAYNWALLGGDGASLDGLASYTPTRPGLYGFSVRVCRDGYAFPCTTSQRNVSVGLGPRYFVPSTISTGFVARGPTIGDFDGDGRRDIAMPSTSVGEGSRPAPDSIDVIFPRDSGFAFEKIPVPGAGRAATGDLSSDAREDLAIVGESALYVARRSAGGPFVVETFPLGPCPPGGATHLADVIAIADANADGRPDLLHLDTCSGELVTRLQTVAGTLAPATSVVMPILGGQLVAVGDLNSDNRADILSGSPAGLGAFRGKFLVLVAHADGSYVAGQEFSLIDSGGAPSLAIGDVTGDGRNDAIAGDETRVLVARQLGDGTLATPDSYPADSGASGDQLLVADYDGDGRQDVRANGGAIFLQAPGGGLLPGFLLPGERDPNRTFLDPNPVDLNGDGVMDLVGHSPDGFRPEQASGPIVLLGRPPDT